MQFYLQVAYWSFNLRKKLPSIKHKQVNFLIFIKIKTLYFLLIKYSTVHSHGY